MSHEKRPFDHINPLSLMCKPQKGEKKNEKRFNWNGIYFRS